MGFNLMTIFKNSDLQQFGHTVENVFQLPVITSIAQRNEVIHDLAKNKITQEQIAAMLDISQSTVSNVLKKK